MDKLPFYILTFLVLGLLAWTGRSPVDDCDRSAQDLCDLRVHTDNLTGLQYLSTRGGGITPRIGIDGKQIRRVK